MTQKRKHPKPRRNTPNEDRPNKKKWKRGLPPEKRKVNQ